MDFTLRIELDLSRSLKELADRILTTVYPEDRECEECQQEDDPAEKTLDKMKATAEDIKKAAKEMETVVRESIKPEPVAETKEESYPSDEEMRIEMNMTIAKFAGLGWEDSKDARTLAIKKGCTKAFKDIAKWLGADKPTALEGEKRKEFITRLSEIFIEEAEGKMPDISFRPF